MSEPVVVARKGPRVEVVVLRMVELHHVGLWRHVPGRDDAAIAGALPVWVAGVVVGRSCVGWVEDIVGEEREAVGVSLGVADVADAVEGFVFGVVGRHGEYWEVDSFQTMMMMVWESSLMKWPVRSREVCLTGSVRS